MDVTWWHADSAGYRASFESNHAESDAFSCYSKCPITTKGLYDHIGLIIVPIIQHNILALTKLKIALAHDRQTHSCR